MEIMLFDQEQRHKNYNKVIVVDVSIDDNRVFMVKAHHFKIGVLRNPITKVRLNSEHEELALSKFKEILQGKKKEGFRYLRSGESIDLVNFRKIFTDKKVKKPKKTEAAKEHRKLSV
jgi:hypothetical protein